MSSPYRTAGAGGDREITFKATLIGDREVKEALGSVPEEGIRAYTRLDVLARQVAASQERAARKAAAEVETAAHRAQNVAENAERARVAATKRAEEARWREVERTGQRIERQMEREAQLAERLAERKVAAEKKARDKFLANPIKGVSERAGGLATSIVGGAIGLASSLLFKGVDAAHAAVRESQELQATTTRLSIAARGAGEGFQDPTALRKSFERTAVATPGVTAAELASGAQEFVGKTGDLNAAMKFTQTFATVASATGASVRDIAIASADIFTKFGIKEMDAAKQVGELQQALTTLTMQGKAGAFELKDAAAQFARIGAAAARFGLKGAEGIKVLGGLAQIARTSVGTGPQAATAVEGMFRQLIAKAGKGTSPFVKGSRNVTKDVRDVIVETIGKNKGDLPKLQKIFDTTGIRAVSPLVKKYNDVVLEESKAGKSDKDARAAGVKAMRDMMDEAMNAAGDWAEIQKDAAFQQSTMGSQLTAAWEKVKMVAGDELAPAISEITTRIMRDGKALDLFIAAIGFAAETVKAFALFLKEKGLISGGRAGERAEDARRDEVTAKENIKSLLGTAKLTDKEKAEQLKLPANQEDDFVASKLSEEDQAKYRELRAKQLIARETKEKADRAEQLRQRELKDISTSTTWSGPFGGEEATKKAYNRLGGKAWSMSIPLLGHNDFLQGLFGENVEQRDVRHAGEKQKKEAFGRAVKAQDGGFGGDAAGVKAMADAERATTDAMSAATAAKNLAAADKNLAAADKNLAAANKNAARGTVFTGGPTAVHP